MDWFNIAKVIPVLYKLAASWSKFHDGGAIGDGMETIELLTEIPETVQKLFGQEDPEAVVSEALRRELDKVISGPDFEFPGDSGDALREKITLEIVVQFLSCADSEKYLKRELLKTLSREPGFDSETFPMDQFVHTLKKLCLTCLYKNPTLAGITSYHVGKDIQKTVRDNQKGISKANEGIEQLVEGQAKILNVVTQQSQPSQTQTPSKPQSEVDRVNQQYASEFDKPLFLHRRDKNTPVKLRNLYVMPDYEESTEGEDGQATTLEDEVREFVHNERENLLILEGGGGCGKTTFIAYLNHLREADPERYRQIFGSQPVVTIRLRDLNDTKFDQSRSLAQAVADHMGLGRVDRYGWESPEVTLLLDGFDELCMIGEFNTKRGDLLDWLLSAFEFSHILLTSRPEYLPVLEKIRPRRLHLTHFDHARRMLWLEKYEKDCGQAVSPTIRSYIEGIRGGDPSCICDIPLVLYMVTATEGTEAYVHNAWSLYNHVFSSTLSDTKYSGGSRAMVDYQDNVYRVSEEIAYWMYQRGNKKYSLNSTELDKIVASVVPETGEEYSAYKMTRINYALCCYWKPGREAGAVEFLHNIIRDFFLAEKVYRVMDTLYEVEPDPEEIAKKLAQLLPYGELEAQVVEFIYLRALAKKGKPRDFAQRDRDRRNSVASKVMTALSGEAIFVPEIFGPNEQLRERKVNAHERTLSIVKNTAYVYQAAFLAHRDPKNPEDRISWLEMESRDYSLFCSLASEILRHGWNRKIAPGYCADLRGAYLQDANLRAANLQGANLQGADLRGAYFQDAKLQYAYLVGALLLFANLQDADLQDADLQGANLVFAKLQDADLQGAYLRGADLRRARLPDGFSRDNQEKQIAHLKSLKIPDLKI